LLPTLSEQITRREIESFQATLNRTVKVILAITLPGAVLLSLVLRPLVAIFDFSASGTEMVVWTARAYLAGLIGHSLLEVAARSFYARQDARTPLMAAGFMLGIFIPLAAWLGLRLGPAGIGLANSIAFTAEALLLLGLLNRQFKGIFRIDRNALRIAGGTVLSGGATYLIAAGLILPGLASLQQGLLSGILLSVAAFTVGALAVLPFIWPEVKLLLKL
jgi:putative peptidoglycan lipid II flippase